MNKMSLEDFKKEINQVREYLKHIEYVNNLANYSNNKLTQDLLSDISEFKILKEHYKNFSTDKKIFEYKATIISLYGLLEKYIETWIKEYLNSFSILVVSYNDIDKIIKDNHFKLSLKLIDSITSRGLPKFQHLKKEEILTKLNQCITNAESYTFNTDAFIISSGNLKHKQIVSLFESINIKLNELLCNNQTLADHIKDENQIQNIKNFPADFLYGRIDDLVERRNEIAHGAETLNILSKSELEPYIKFLEKYCQAVFEILTEQFIKQKSIHKFQKIENVINVFNKTILAFEIENYTIKVGDTLIVESQEGHFCEKSINTIQLDGVPHQEIIVTEKKNIGISVEPKISDKNTFYIVKK
ncbi:MAG: hypothetical protein IM470_16670 [Microcystis sp. M158S2]|nr:hypothetical protein [Microcystis sp. M158S2]